MTQFDPALTARALTARAPRYTSYPPTTHFTDAVGPAEAAAWLARVPQGADVSLYVHIPFCRRLCWFCACRTQGTKTGAPLGPYLDALAVEIETVARALPTGVRVSHLHLGGGTPTLLSPNQTARLFGLIDAVWPRSPGGEVSVEVDPTEIDEARLDALAAVGITRASLGVQDFETVVQSAIGRSQSVEQTAAAVEGLRARGVRGINLDLLYGLPFQTSASLDRTLDRVLALAPDRLALYGYAHVPWASKRQVMIRATDLPNGSARLDLARDAARRLTAAGYRAVGIDHFARPGDSMARAAEGGTLRRNFQGYTTDRSDVLIGLGASAISKLPGGYAQNAPRTCDWSHLVSQGRLATARGHALTPEDRLRGAMIERLLSDFAIDPAAQSDPAQAQRLTGDIASAWDGIVSCGRDGRLVVDAEASHLLRLVAAEIDAYAALAGRHSMAV